MSSSTTPPFPSFTHLTITPAPPPNKCNIYIITMRKLPENRINVSFGQEMILALRSIESHIGRSAPGAVIIIGSDRKFWCTGVDLDEAEHNPHSSADGFLPLLATLLDYPFPTVAAVTGHTFGGGVPFMLSCDYRVMNRARGFISMPPVDLGLHFDGIGALPRLKLGPRVARRMLLEAERWTGVDAQKEGIVDEVVAPEELEAAALKIAERVAPKARMGVYAALRHELWGEALGKIGPLAGRHGRRVITEAKAKI